MPSPFRTRLLSAVIAVGVLAGALIWWQWPDPPPALATSVAQIGDIESSVVATGSIAASRLVSVGAQASGQIKSLKVQLGDVVRTGDLIAEIDSTTQENALRNAQASITTAQAQRSAQLASLRRNQAAFDRQQQMLAAEATSQAEFDLAQAELIASREQIKVLDAQIIQSETALSTAKANLGYTRISAPMDGTVVALVVEEGQTVNANQSTPTIVKLAKLDTVTISAEISEADVIKVKPGQPVYFTILGNPQKRYHATLRKVEPAPASIATEGSNAASGGTASAAIYYNGLFDVDNPDGELRISMTAMVYIVMAQAQDVLIIPSSALGERSRDGGYSVRVVNAKGETERRTVTIGINTNVSAQVLEGLVEGETVVVGEASATRAPVSADQQRRVRRLM